MSRPLLALVLALLVAGGAGTAPGQAADDEPRSGWEGFPLDPAPTLPSDPTAPSRAHEDPRSAPPRDRAPSDAMWLTLVGAALLGGVALGAVAVQLARRQVPALRQGRPRSSQPEGPAIWGTTASITPSRGGPGGDADRCEVAVARWRNRAWFCALRPESDRPIVTSPEFPLRRRDPLTLTPAAVAAIEALTVGLERLGWRFAGQGPAWFMRHFVGPEEPASTPEAPAARWRGT
jgi:hypothetical protein